MRRLSPICSIAAIALFLPTIAAAQNTSVGGQIEAPDGKPWVDLDLTIQNTNTGQQFGVKTDKDGRYNEVGLPPGVYEITIHDPKTKWFSYSEIRTLRANQEYDFSFNFSKTLETAQPEPQMKGEKDNKFSYEKSHFDVGVGAMYDASMLGEQLGTAPADQKGPLQDRLSSDYQTAIREFLLAEQADSGASQNTRASIWASLGEAYVSAGQYVDAENAYQQAIALRPEAVSYQNLSEAQASSALAQTDPKEIELKLADADATCDKAAALDPAAGAACWKNIGILLSNKGDMADAIVPLKKTTQLDPNDAQAWFLLGTALLATVQTKQEGNVITSVFSPETSQAFQKCIEVDPNGPYASQAKELLDELVSLTVGEKTKVEDKKEK
jgi:tetratricopeptide (TPR) repeat protein